MITIITSIKAIIIGMTKANFSFPILIVGILQLIEMKKKNKDNNDFVLTKEEINNLLTSLKRFEGKYGNERR